MTVIVCFSLYFFAEISQDNLREATAWLQMFKEPESRVLELWKLTAQCRLNFIHSDTAPSLNKVLEAWPRIGDPKGYLLVNFKLCIFTLLPKQAAICCP